MNRIINKIKHGLKAAFVCAVIPIMLSGCWEGLEDISEKVGEATVTYHVGTGHTSGSVPIDPKNYNSGDTVIVLDNTDDLKGEIIHGTTPKAFLGWDTNPSAEVAQYKPGDTFTFTGNTTLYAIYTALRVIGPAGGLIFYDAGHYLPWGRYLEAAPADIISPSTIYQWKTSNNSTTGTSPLIGYGKVNTEAMAGDTHPAAEACRDYNVSTYNDWFLPSRNELDMMCWNLRGKSHSSSSFHAARGATDNPDVTGGGVGDFESSLYHSSSQNGDPYAYDQHFDTGILSYSNKTNDKRVRAVRSF